MQTFPEKKQKKTNKKNNKSVKKNCKKYVFLSFFRRYPLLRRVSGMQTFPEKKQKETAFGKKTSLNHKIAKVVKFGRSTQTI